jgi:two-component system NtrC family sensor kinase
MPGEPQRFLVVDDDLPIAQMMASILADEGYEVDVAGNGRQALELIAVQHYDLILTDLRMPVLDGAALYRELERQQPDLLRRLVIITGTSGHPEYETFLAETQVPFLEKPFSLASLLAITRQVLSTVSPSVR